MHTLEKWKRESEPGSSSPTFVFPPYNGDSRFPTHFTPLLSDRPLSSPLLDLPLQIHTSIVPPSPDTQPLFSPISAPTPAEGSTPLLQLCPLPLASLYYVLVLLGYFWRHRPACLPQGQDLEGRKGAVNQSGAQALQLTPLSPAGQIPTFLSNRSWSKANTLRLCSGRADLQVERG